MEDKHLSEQESLTLIEQMIQTAKLEQKDDGTGWIVWGWVLFAASVLTYINMETRWFSTFFFWNLFGLFTILAFVFSFVKSTFFKKPQRVRTYTADLFEKLNIGFFLTLALIIVSINVGINADNAGDNASKGFSLLIGLYAFWVLIYGTATNFKPSIVAAFVMWGIAFVSLFMLDFKTVMLLHALAVLCGYIIPGHLANKAFKKVHPASYNQL
jgi:hypothetical protein